MLQRGRVQLEKPQLFSSQKSFAFMFTLLIILFLIRLAFLYQNYQTFLSKPFYFTYAEVIYETSKYKNKKEYKVLRLHSNEGLDFFRITSYNVCYTKLLRLLSSR